MDHNTSSDYSPSTGSDVSPNTRSPNQRSNRRHRRGRENDRSKLAPLNEVDTGLESEQLIQQAKPDRNSPNKNQNRIVAPNPIISTTNSNFQSIPSLSEPERRSLGAPHLEVYDYKGTEHELLNFVCAPPAPCPPCSDLLPSEEVQLERQRTAQLHRDEQLPEASRGGMWVRLATTFSNMIHSFERGVDQITYSVTDLANEHIDMAAYDRLRAHFPIFADEKIVGCYHCNLVTRNGSLDGFLEITNNHVYFIQQGGSSVQVRLSEVLNIMRLKLAPAGNICHEHYIPLFESNERSATAIEFFVTSGQLLLFNDFRSLRQTPEHLVQECYNVSDHVWRSATEVPNKYWSYADAGTFLQPNCEPVPFASKGRGYTPPPM